MSLGSSPGAEPAGHLDAQAMRAQPLPERLRGQDVLDLAGADPEGQRPEGAVGAGVAVAADDRRPGQRQPQLGTDHVDDPLVAALDVVERDAELAAVGPQRLDLPPRQAGRGCRAGSRSARCDRPWRTSGRAGAPGGRPAAGPRTPADSSPRAPGAGRCTAASPRRSARPRGDSRPSRTVSRPIVPRPQGADCKLPERELTPTRLSNRGLTERTPTAHTGSLAHAQLSFNFRRRATQGKAGGRTWITSDTCGRIVSLQDAAGSQRTRRGTFA